MTYWFSKRKNGEKIYCSKSISINYYKQHWKLLSIRDNGATKEDSCYDLNINILGLFISYTNWDYNE